MKYVNLGRSGLKVSRLCLGCMSKSALYRRIFYGSLALCKNAAYR